MEGVGLPARSRNWGGSVHRWPFWMAIAVAMTVLLAIAVFGVLVERSAVPFTPPVSVAPAPPGSVVDLRTRDGHPATVLRLRLYDVEREEVVWDLHTNGRWARLENIPLQPGPNPALTPELLSWHFEVTVPEDGEDFDLTSGAEYEMRVWSVVGDGPAARRAEWAKRFVLGESAIDEGSP